MGRDQMRTVIAVGIVSVACLSLASHAYQYIGCYEDKLLDRILKGKVTIDYMMTVPKCLQICIREGDYYAGLENGEVCYCGKHMENYRKFGEDSCVTDCSGDSSQKCGGMMTASIYTTSVCSVTAEGDPCPANSACNDTRVGGSGICTCPLGYAFNAVHGFCEEAYRYAGCYEDREDRILKGKVTYGAMTILKCVHTCVSEGDNFAGLENGNECHCGDVLENYDRLEDSSCNFICDGNFSQTCGADMKISVYTTNVCTITAAGDPCPANSACSKQTLHASGVCQCSFGYIFDMDDKFCEKVCTVTSSGDACPGESSCSDQVVGGSGVCKCPTRHTFDSFTGECMAYSLTIYVGEVETYKMHLEASFNFVAEKGKHGIVSTPLYYLGEDYRSDMKVSWYIIASDGHDILLNFLDFSTEHCCDHLSVDLMSSTGDETSPFFSETADGVTTLESSGQIKLRFISDNANVGSGFMLKYQVLLKDRVLTTYGSEFDANGQLQQVILERVDDPLKESYYFKIRGPAKHQINLTVAYMDMEPTVYCTKDYIKIFDGEMDKNGLLLAHICRHRRFGSAVTISSVQESVYIEYSCKFAMLSDHGTLCAVINYRAYVHDSTALQGEGSVQYKQSSNELLPLDTNYLLFKVKVTTGIKGNVKLLRYRSWVFMDYVNIEFKEADSDLSITLRFVTLGLAETPRHFRTNISYGRYQDFWIFKDGQDIKLGEGLDVGDNQLGTIFVGKTFDFTAFTAVGFEESILYQTESEGCDKQTAWILMRLCRCAGSSGSMLVANAESTFSHGAAQIYYENILWTIDKGDGMILNLMIEQSHLAETVDCMYERVTIYRGYCPRRSTVITYFCGQTIERFTQVDGRYTTIEYRSSPIPRHILLDQNLIGTRVFTIKYELLENYKEKEEEVDSSKPLKVGLVLAIVSVVAVVIAAAVVATVLWKKKSASRRARTGPIHPLQDEGKTNLQYPRQPSPNMQYPQQPSPNMQYPQQPAPNQPIMLNINIDNAKVSSVLPSAQNMYGDKVETTVTYSGIPPPAEYESPPAYSVERPIYHS